MSRVLLVTAFLMALVLGCGGGDDKPETGITPPAPSTTLEIVASNLKFDKEALAAPPNSEVTLKLDNRDAGALHNVAIYTDEGMKTKVYASELFAGKAEKTYTFTTPAAGTYYFRCDAHPDMKGTFFVLP